MMNIDGKEYDLDLFSEEAKAQLNNIKFIDSELARFNAQAAAL